MKAFFVKTVVSAIALWIVDALWNSIWVTPEDGSALNRILIYLVIGVVVTVVNLIIRPVARIIAFPLYILTLGLFGLILNALLLLLVSWITVRTPFGLHIENFSTAVGAGLVLAILTALISIPFKKVESR